MIECSQLSLKRLWK